MTNPRELIARLNVPAVRYEIGRGGIPDLTNVDIAAALGMVQDEFARDVFTVLWWPDGAKNSSSPVTDRILSMLLTEYGRRQRELVVAKLEQNMAECAMKLKRAPTHFDDRVLRACAAAVDKANKAAWRYKAEIYVRIPAAVLYELEHPRLCDECDGRGEVWVGKLREKCEVCKGFRTRPEKKINRALRIGATYERFRDIWQPVYQWAFDLVSKAERAAAFDFAEAVAREAIA